MSIYFVDKDFNKFSKTPFNYNEGYGPDWVFLKLLESAAFKQYTGGGRDGIFQLVITKQNIDWEYRILDFIQYNTACHNNIILSVDKSDYHIAEETYGNSKYNDNFLRSYEKPILVHSTSIESYNKIIACGYLKSWNVLSSDGLQSEAKPIGELLGDPLDYRDYIMFNNGGVSAERVVSSRQKGYLEMNVDQPYIPGARLYFDGKKITEDGLLIRDGAYLKVKTSLPLDKYLNVGLYT